jgi:hypothetical protein
MLVGSMNPIAIFTDPE